MTLRKFLFWSHLIMGLVVGLVVFVKSVTGIILAFEPQIVAWSEKSVRVVTPVPQTDRLELNDLIIKTKAVFPDEKLNRVMVKSDPSQSVLFSFGKGNNHYVNPYSAEIMGNESKTHHLLHDVEDFHRWFGFKPLGKPISGYGTIGFFLLAVSGVYLWWPRKTTRFNSQLTGKARDWNWHNVIGFWSAPFLVLITFTGVVMAFPWATNGLYRLTGSEPPAVQKGPQYPENSFSVFIEEPTSWGPYKRTHLRLDSTTLQVIKSESPQDWNRGRRARSWMKPLHTGEAGGWLGQIIAALVTFGASFLVWTGAALAYRRFFKN